MAFDEKEISFVKQNMHEYPSILARSLGLYYPEHNGGSRNTQSVSRLMNKIRTARDPNSPDLPEDEAIVPNTLMRDLPPVAAIPTPPVTSAPPVPVAEIGTRVEGPVATPTMPEKVTPIQPVTIEPVAQAPQVAKVPKPQVKKSGGKRKR